MALSGIRRALPFATIVVFLALLYDGWIFYSRWSAGRQVQEARAAKESQRAQQTLERIGGTDLKILNFFAEPAGRPGALRLCYSVINAKTLRVEPPIGDVYPALSHCLPIAPRQTTAYKLIAGDGAGHQATQNLVVRVKP